MKRSVIASTQMGVNGGGTIPVEHIGTGLALGLALGSALIQVTTGDPMAAIKDYGIAVVVIAWFMYRNEKRMEGLTAEVRKLAKALILSNLDNHDERERLKQELLRDLDERE